MLQVKRYLDSCPRCGGQNIELNGDAYYDGDCISDTMWCPDCGLSWDYVYRFECATNFTDEHYKTIDSDENWATPL